MYFLVSFFQIVLLILKNNKYLEFFEKDEKENINENKEDTIKVKNEKEF